MKSLLIIALSYAYSHLYTHMSDLSAKSHMSDLSAKRSEIWESESQFRFLNITITIFCFIFPPGNVFHACVGMADLILSAAVMPISAVVLLSGQWDINPVCQVVQVLTEASTYCYSLFFTVSTIIYVIVFMISELVIQLEILPRLLM